MKRQPITAQEISERLAERVESVCTLLLPGGRIVKDEYICGSVDGGEGKSLHVHLTGTYRGNWTDWATQEHGDLVDLWRTTRNTSRTDAFRQVKEYLGIAEDVLPAKAKVYGKPAEKQTPKTTPGSKSFNWLTTERKLKPEVIARFRVSTDARAIVFPCHSPTGELINRSYRTLPTNGEKKQVWQDKDCAPCLFGWHALPESAYRDRTVLLAEGQIDAMTWDQWGVPALSIPAGSGQTWIGYEWDNLAIFDKILIAFDADQAGQTNAESAIKRLGAHRCHLVQIPHKDPNEALQAGVTAEEAQSWVAKAKAPQLDGLISGADLMSRLMEEIKEKPKPLCLKWMDIDWPEEKGFYFRPGEVTLWTGSTGNGKSTFLNYLQTILVGSGLGVFVASLEIRVETTLRKTAQAFYGITGVNKQVLQECHFASWLLEYGEQICFCDRVGYISQEELLEMMEFAFRRFGAKHMIIDSLMRIEGLEENYPAQGEFMNRLSEFADSSGAHIHLVAHPRKVKPGASLDASDVKGSSLIANNADNIVSISRNADKWELIKNGTITDEQMRSLYDTEISVEKQRESGWTGRFYLRFDPRRLAFEPMSK